MAASPATSGPQPSRSSARLWGLAVLVAVVVLGPALGAGYVLHADEVFVPQQDLLPWMLGVGAGILMYIVDPPLRGEGEAVVGTARASSRTWFRLPFLAVCLAATATTVVLAGSDIAIIAVMRDIAAEGQIGLVLAVWGLVRLARSADLDQRRHGIVGLVVFASFVLLQASWLNPWGGESYGPRYLIPGLPFLIVGMVEVWERAARVRWFAVTWSVVAMALAVIALHLVPDGAIPMGAQLQSLRTDGPVPTLWTLALGPASGWFVQLATIACAAHLLQLRLAQDAAAAPVGVPDQAISLPLQPVAGAV